ncbi:protein Z, vitamin K-dependent plasma glycoprotein b [Embiotoca jacksoni]|uniref:protein Z, vitamin K-dependent plasma glycoprotein b n=1 Tax=Embiotoca jacksoni TaxID=100190 RepID=UPI003703AEE5
MAAGIMSASLLTICLLECFLRVFGRGEVFRGAPEAHAVFLRPKRANTFLVEEILQGNLERECYEEMCSYEEAREYFEDNDHTVAFWTVYFDGDQCDPNPCLHGGNCTDKVGGFSCSCTAPHSGPVCEREPLEVGGLPYPAPHPPAAEVLQCPTKGPTACHQLCKASYASFTCSCMSGFELQSDGRSCQPEVEFPCGRLPDATRSMCHHGNCPWQASLLDSWGAELCGGVVLGQRSILTSASCLFLDSGSDPRPSKFYVVAGNRRTRFPVRALYLHNRFRLGHHDNDLALLELASPLPFGPTLIHLCLPTKDFSENILMHSGRVGVSMRRGGGVQNQNQNLVYMMLDECRRQLNVSYSLNNKMFCMGNQNVISGNQNGTQRRQNEPSGNEHGAESPNGALRNQNGTQRSPDGGTGNQDGVQGRLSGHAENRIQNQTQDLQNGTPNRAQNYNRSSNNHKASRSGGRLRSEVSGRSCGGLLPGSPVATVEHGTAFLTGLLISSSAGCDGGLVFTKLSRYVSWIHPRLEAVEDHMTPQINQYPESR